MNPVLKVQRLDPEISLPSYSREGDAGLDLRSRENYILKPDELYTINTGIKVEIPSGYFGSIRDRSGFASKNGLHILAGVVDSNYRGEIKVVLKNLGDTPIDIKRNDRIAQLLIQKIEIVEVIEVDNLEETERGERGFGSSGES